MTILQDIMGLITKRKIKTPSDNDYIISAAYTDTQERLKPQPKMEASLLSLSGIKKYVLASIAPPKYKVFTALLTQSGGDGPTSIDLGPVTKGVTYRIVNSEGDFSNVGAPNNNDGTYFVATNNEIPNNYGIDGQLQFNTGAPVATVLENSIGNIWFTYNDVGFYLLNSTNSFLLEKTFCQGTTKTDEDGTGLLVITVRRDSIDLVNIFSTNPINERANNDRLSNTPIEIRVYN